MAIAGKLDPSTVGERLSTWLERTLDVGAVQPEGAGLFPSYDVMAEARVISAIAPTVPESWVGRR